MVIKLYATAYIIGMQMCVCVCVCEIERERTDMMDVFVGCLIDQI